MITAEILAPAGSYESLISAVRCGANAVYLGGKAMNARRSAENFDGDAFRGAVKYCHARDVKVYLTLNTLINDRELDDMAVAVKSAYEAGVDALIVQDLGVAAFARAFAPSLPLHASTQMSIINASGARLLESLGFTRVVLARELSCAEIVEIKESTGLSLEAFVHGALCMCVSGQCYLSAMLGGRSGNRGLCAQPCRLPFSSNGREYCLSLKDLSLIERIPEMLDAGISSFKIEGRMKRPEYVAAAVTAVRQKLLGEEPDLASLKSVFSRDGFTSGYFDGKTGFDMFGQRRREDVVAASPALLSGLAVKYKDEQPLIPVKFSLSIKESQPASLTVTDGAGNSVTATGEIPQNAKTSPTTPEKAAASLAKTGGTPFFAAEILSDIGDGLMLPASGLNALRRAALEDLLGLRENTAPRALAAKPEPMRFAPHTSSKPEFRVRIASAEQFTKTLADAAELMLVPAGELFRLDKKLVRQYAGKIAVELPRITFGQSEAARLESILESAKTDGISRAIAGNLGGIEAPLKLGFKVGGDYSLNITNTLALDGCADIGLCDATLSFELTSKQISKLGGKLSRGILAYGYLPLMATRNCPVGDCASCDGPVLTDRLKNRFPVRCTNRIPEILNCVPLFLADRLDEFSGVDFLTLYFTVEAPEYCEEILRLYQTSGAADFPKTRGLYFRGVE